MSYATLTDADPARREGQRRPQPEAGSGRDSSSPAHAWRFFALTGLVLAMAAGMALRSLERAEVALAMLTVLAAGAAAAGVYRTLYPLARPDDLHRPLLREGRTRAALERDKALTLRAIKELEFDHAMKKVADADFEDVRRRLRSRALRLIRQLEGTSAYRSAIERDVEARLARGASGTAPAPAAPHSCAECGTGNEPDARFCKMCGRPLGREIETR